MGVPAGSTDNPENEQPAKNNPATFKGDKTPFIGGMLNTVTIRFAMRTTLLLRAERDH